MGIASKVLFSILAGTSTSLPASTWYADDAQTVVMYADDAQTEPYQMDD